MYIEDNEWQTCKCPDGYARFGDTCFSVDNETLSSITVDEARVMESVYYFDIEYASNEDKTLWESGVFKLYFVESYIGCKENRDPQKCQVLANLCVLNLYYKKSEACDKYLFIRDSEDKTSPDSLSDYEGAEDVRS